MKKDRLKNERLKNERLKNEPLKNESLNKERLKDEPLQKVQLKKERLMEEIVLEFSKEIQEYWINNECEYYFLIDAVDIGPVVTDIALKREYPLIMMFANDERSLNGKFAVHYIFANKKEGILLIVKAQVNAQTAHYPSITNLIYAADLYEREIHDLFGIEAVGHPDLKRMVVHKNWPKDHYPLRKDFDAATKPPLANVPYPFTQIKGNDVYEVPVGPVHAGIIEPGHFRFSVVGEPVINLEAQLFYVHRGIEKLCEGKSIEQCLYMSERISGDETFSNSLAYCQAVEKLSSTLVPERAMYTRVIFAEVERITSHLGDLAGICLDVAYGFAGFQFRMMRGWLYQLADALCGMRFLRSVNRLGGVRQDFILGKETIVLQAIAQLKTELLDTQGILHKNTMFLDRIENTGVLNKKTALDLNAVGPGGRASGIRHDARKTFPYAVYDKLDFKIPLHNNGDVNCRMNVKLEECFESMHLIEQAIHSMPLGAIVESIHEIPSGKCAFSITESPRGENIHYIQMGEKETIFRYKIRTPSFCNWPVLCHAVKGNIIPDFPLINKSFNLSYAGNDL